MGANGKEQLPLSLMAAFFAINLESFPVNENGKLAMPFVLKYMRKNPPLPFDIT